MDKKELVQVIKDKRLATYVSTNWWQMARSDMKDIIVQLIFTLYDNNLTEKDIDINELLERLDLD